MSRPAAALLRSIRPIIRCSTRRQRCRPSRSTRLGIGDELEIKFAYNPELNLEHIPVRPDGRISIPLAKQIKVAGLTTQQVEDILVQKYATELRKPEVTVIVRGFNAQRVFVDGEVNRAGLIPLMGPLTALQSIAMSGGFKDTARVTEVIVIRRTQDKPIVSIIDLEKARENKDMTQDVYLMPSDIVYVPRSQDRQCRPLCGPLHSAFDPVPAPGGYPHAGLCYSVHVADILVRRYVP